MIKLGIALVVILVAYSYLKSAFEQKLPVVVDGHVHPAFKPVLEKLRENVASGKEPGASFSVYYKGEALVDIWGGYADAETHRPWRQDTMSMMFSCTKGVASIVVAYLVDRGHLDYKQPVAKYWPGFAQNGKEKITVETLLSHQAGLALLDTSLSLRDVGASPEKVEKILEQQKPVWEPGTKVGYHMTTFGLYVDTLIRKADPKGRTVDQLFNEEIAKPFDVELFMALPKEKFYRAARITFDDPLTFLYKAALSGKYFMPFLRFFMYPDSMMAKAAKPIQEIALDQHMMNDPELRAVPMSSTSGTSSARGLAKLYSIVADKGQYKGKSLMKKSTIDQLVAKRVSKPDVVTEFSSNMTFAAGLVHFGSGKDKDNLLGKRSYGHSGHGGQMGYADLDREIGVGYVTNYISVYADGNDPRFEDLIKTFFTCFSEYKKTLKSVKKKN